MTIFLFIPENDYDLYIFFEAMLVMGRLDTSSQRR